MPPCRAWASLPVLLAALVVVSADEGCSSPVMDALAEDEDLPLSLIQVRAVATRSNRTDLANRTLNITLPAKPGSQFHIMGPNERMVIAGPANYDALRVLYFALLIGVIIFSAYPFAHYVRSLSEAKKQSIPKMQHLVDHLVVTSTLSFSARADNAKNPLTDNTKNPLTLQAKQSNDGFQKGPKPPQNVALATTPKGHHSSSESIDPALVLPLRETWYAVAIEQVLKTDGSFEILRMTGSQSLRASVSYSSGFGGALELLSCSGGATKHLLARAASIEPAKCGAEASKLPLTLVDVEGRQLGELRLLSHRSFELTCDSETVVTLVVTDEGQLEVLSARGNRLASVSCLAGHLSICVEAGTDTALVICLVLAVVLLGGAGEYVLPHGSDDRYDGQVVCTPDMVGWS